MQRADGLDGDPCSTLLTVDKINRLLWCKAFLYKFNTSALQVALQLGESQPSQSCSDLSRVLPLEPNRLFWNVTDLNL